MSRQIRDADPARDGFRAALEASWEGNWARLIRRLREDVPLQRIERAVLADALEKLVNNGKLRPIRGAKELDVRMSIAEYVYKLTQEGINKTEAVRRAEDQFGVETAVVWKACKEWDDLIWTSPFPDYTP